MGRGLGGAAATAGAAAGTAATGGGTLRFRRLRFCLPVGRQLLGRLNCSIIKVVVVVTNWQLPGILLDIILLVIPRVLLLSSDA